MDRGSKATTQRGPWKPEEDLLLKRYIEIHGEGKWSMVSKRSGLMRGGKSCRLRWKNYLRPDLKRGEMSSDEEDLIIRMHKLLGNRWSLIAGRLPGRTDNEVKNYFYTHLRKRPSKKETVGSQSKKRRSLNHPENQPDQNTTDDSFEETLLDNITDEGDARITVPDRKDDIKSFLCDTPYQQYTEDKPFQPSVNPSLWLESFGHNIDAYWAENLIFSTEEIYPNML